MKKNLLALLMFTSANVLAEEAVLPDVSTSQADAPVTQMESMQVRAKTEDSGYNTTHTSAGTKTDSKFIETPISVQVVPQAVLDDQRVNRLQEALENVSGLRSHNNDLEGYTYNIRGFQSLNLFRNGLAVPLSIANIEETANVEQVEVLKGPSSILYGRIDPGGLINLVTKKPLSEPYYKLEQEFGSYSHKRTVWDATGPLNDRINYRFSGAYQDDDSFRDFQGGHRILAAPEISIKLGENTDLLIDLQYMKNNAQSDTGFPVIGTKPAPIPLKRSFQEPNDPLDKTEGHSIGYELKHQFNDNWTISNRFLYSQNTLWKLNVFGNSLDELTGVLNRTTQHQWLDGQVYSTNLDLNGKFEALGAKHDVLFGIDYLHDYYDYKYAEGGGNFQINIFNPVYGGISASDYQDAINGVGFVSYSSSLNKQIGLYAQDQITLFDKLHLLIGGRYDDAKTVWGGSSISTADAINTRKSTPMKKDSQFSPRVGALYQFTPGLSGFASYSESFGANNGISATGSRFDPERGIQYEVGMKAEILSGLTANLAVFNLTKENVLTPDLSTPDPNDSIAIGEIRSKGLEFDVLGQITDRLSVIGAYAYTDTKVTKDTSGLQGNRLDNVPRNSGSVFLTYDFGSGGEGWRVGGGAFASETAIGDKANTFIIPGYVRLDAFASYSRKVGANRWTAQLNIHNLLDKNYFAGTDVFYNAVTRINLLPAQPLNATASIKLEF